MRAWLRSLLLVAHLQDWCFCECYDKSVWLGEAPAASEWGTCCLLRGELCPPSFTSLHSSLRLLRCRPERRERRVVVWPLHGRKLYGCKTLFFFFALVSHFHLAFGPSAEAHLQKANEERWGAIPFSCYLKTFIAQILEQTQVLFSDRFYNDINDYSIWHEFFY